MTRSAIVPWLLVGGLLLAACGGGENTTDAVRDDTTGEVASESDLGVYRMQVGDCFDSPASGQVTSVDAVPCADPHDREVYAIWDYDGPSSSFPGDQAMQEAAEAGCLDRFEAFAGEPYEVSDLYVGTLRPSTDTWDRDGDREVICYVYLEDGQLTGSAKDWASSDGGGADGSGDGSTGVSGGGQTGTMVSVFELLVGDCYDDDSEGRNSFGEPTVGVIDCANPHDNEVYATFDLPDGAYPGDEAVRTEAVDGCLDEFEPYVGLEYEASVLDIFWLGPSEETWASGDREVVCVLYHIDLEKLEGSMAGAAV